MNLLAYPYAPSYRVYRSCNLIQLMHLIPSAPTVPRLDGEPGLIQPRASTNHGSNSRCDPFLAELS